MRALVLTCMISLMGIQSVSGQQKPQAMAINVDTAAKASQQSARGALETLRQMVNATNYRAMGFDSVGDVGAAVLGDPLVIFYVRLDLLREYQAQSDPRALLGGGERVLYPVLVRGQTRSSITVAHEGGSWKGVSFGGANGARLAWKILSESSKGANPAPPHFLVEVLALSVHFLGFEQSGKLMLVPLLNDPQQRWKAGVPRVANEVFAQLVVDARAYNGLPR